MYVLFLGVCPFFVLLYIAYAPTTLTAPPAALMKRRAVRKTYGT